LIAAVLPIHYPRELLRAFDILPMEVWGPPNVDPSFGSAHVQAYVCSIVRNGLSFLHSDTATIADLILVPHACDSLQGLGSLLLDFVQPEQPVFPLYLPRRTNSAGVQFLANEFRALYERLEQTTGRSPSDDELMECIQREEKADVALGEMHANRRKIDLSDFEFYRLIRTREYLPAEDFLELVAPVREQGIGDLNESIGILISGIVPEPMDTLQAINDFSGMVVGDDLACTGRRVYPPGENGDPFLRMAERVLGGPPDWALGSPINSRMDHLLETIERTGARGVIFYGVKFCEPELFDLPMLRDRLDRESVPSMALEVDLNDTLSTESLMHLEAFFEMLA
jgi:benzoyl-CoA reductase/2-hydroxyglutaryl-CoA dehydratase subunit BcrC/BadD/HgdB